ncbi:TPA: hypothetical protein ACVNTL_001225 [Legionella pneumophila]|uniref:hypothetical protein n=1 Tax=Legionella pneumophila TaxID=446 RepID=UPI00373403CF
MLTYKLFSGKRIEKNLILILGIVIDLDSFCAKHILHPNRTVMGYSTIPASIVRRNFVL